MSQDMCHLTQQHVVRMVVQVAFVLPFCAFSKAPAPEHCSERTQANQQVLGQLEVWLHLVSLENPQVLIGII